MARMVQCLRLGTEAEGLDFPPVPGALGQKIFENISKEGWQQWLKHQTMLINENRLSMLDPRARQYLLKQCEAFFFGDGADAAADTPNGLVVPVIRDADKKGIVQISQEMGDLAKKARDGKLGPADMTGGCFSISSLGGIGGRYFTPIINAPEVAIMGVCKSSLEPKWDGQQFAPRLMLPLSLSWDHRVIDGASAARFNVYFASLLADFRRIVM